MDAQSRLSIASICHLMQDAAGHHAENNGLGIFDLLRNGHTWILTRLIIKIHQRPKMNDELLIKTWAKEYEDAFVFRDYLIKDKKEQTLIAATTSWAIIDFRKRKPVPVTSYKEKILLHQKEALKQRPQKLPEIARDECREKYKVRYSEIDVNQHANFARYIDWVLDSYPEPFHTQSEVSEIQVNYRAEARLNNELLVYSRQESEEPLVFMNTLVRQKDNTEICRMQIEWKDKNQ